MSTTTRALEANNKVRAGSIGRRLDGDDFRVGSYVVHTPPTTPTSSNGGGRVAISSRSNIPGYQFKSKIATINQNQQSPPLSPKKNSTSEPVWAQGSRIWNQTSPGSGFGDGCDARRQHYQSLQSSSPNCSPHNQINTSLTNATSPKSSHQPPKAIPRSMFSLKQQSSLTSRTSQLHEYEPNNMGDRLSSPAIQHLSYNSSSASPSGVKHHHSVDFDHWNGQLSPTFSRFQLSQRDQIDIIQRENGGTKGGGSSSSSNSSGGAGGIGGGTGSSGSGGDEVFKLTPRLPRGVSKIPHQVNAHENVNANPYQSHESTMLNCLSNSNRYLTFSKDQATSHYKSLKEELEGQKRDTNRKDKENRTPISTSPAKPKPLKRLSRAIEANDKNIVEHAKFSKSTTIRQQPICEAFIMTGQSMLKLSCNESENNNNNTNSQKQTEAKLKSLSLDKLSSSQDKEESHMSSENTDQLKGSTHEQPADTKINKPREAPREKPTNSEIIAATTATVTTATLSTTVTQMQAETKTTPLTSSKAAPDLDNHLGINAVNNVPCSIIVGQAHQTATSNKPKTITETKARQPEADSKHITDSFWNQTKQAKSTIPEPQPKNDKLSAGCKEPSLFIKGKQDMIRDEDSMSLPSVGDLLKNETEGPSTATMNNLEEVKLKQPLETDKNHESQILEAIASTMPSTPNCNDRDSAKRLAKRLYNLSGFKRSDVCHHLAKSNPFSQMVAEEYVNLFDFRSMKLDGALRKFLSKLQLNGETQERERMLSQFSQRYYDCNKEKFPNADTVQTLVCALILLNTDLHGGHNKKKRSKLSLGAFIDGLNNSIAGGPDCGDNEGVVRGVSAVNGNHAIAYTFPRHLLIDLYESIKKRPLKCSDDKCDMTSLEAELDKIYSQQVGNNRSNTLPTRRFAPGSNAPSSTLDASSRRHFKQGLSKLNSSCGGQDDSDTAIQFKSGYLNRKRVFEAHGKPTSKGRRSWRRVYVILQDLRMIMQQGIYDDMKAGDDPLAKRATRAQTITQKMKNTVKIHHTFAKASASYTKRDHVFYLRLADQSEFLLQANDGQEMSSWIDTINFATACLSSPALPSAISSSKQHQPQNQKPLLPAAYTKLSYWEQLIDHEERLQRLKVELDEHLSEASNTKNANKKFKTEFIEKIAFLKHEIERYTVYVDLMRKKSNSPEAIVLSKHPHIASLTPSDGMILSLPSFAPPRSVLSAQQQQQQ